MTKHRYKVKFPSRPALDAALAIEMGAVHPVVTNRRRSYIAVEPSAAPTAESSEQERDDVERQLEIFEREFAAKAVVDFQYDLEQGPPHIFAEVAPEAVEASLDDVLNMTGARNVWPTSIGEGVTIAIVDTGVDGTRPEFPAAKRDGGWAVPGDDAWTDWQGHGTMCACIAAGTRSAGGNYDGVAPGAKIMPCKTRFYDSELAAIYDTLADRAKAGTTIVASNSFGIKSGVAPTADPNSDLLPALDDAIAAGVSSCSAPATIMKWPKDSRRRVRPIVSGSTSRVLTC